MNNDLYDNHEDLADNHANFLTLSLSTHLPPSPPPSYSIAAAPPPLGQADTMATGTSHQRRAPRRNANQGLRPGKPTTIPPPYPWATTQRATVHSLRYLEARGVNTISGRVQCRRCDRQFDVEYDLQKKFSEVAIFIMKGRDGMRHRAPPEWMNPSLPDCRFCEQKNCAKPVQSKKKKEINWVFLFLGQMIGCCKLAELKYLCKHTRNHRTGAKDRVLYLTYLELCRQLDPEGPYHR